tara:strand:+ start:802 stop:1149 length:348 start_codon:yes stop_codon:yes gene_type:complete
LNNDYLVTVIEHPGYLRSASKLLSRNQLDEIADYLAANPKSGDLIKGTGGCRKLRYAGVSSKGKSSGARVIHIFIANDHEVHLIDVYLKGIKNDLSKLEMNELAKLAALLKGEKS